MKTQIEENVAEMVEGVMGPRDEDEKDEDVETTTEVDEQGDTEQQQTEQAEAEQGGQQAETEQGSQAEQTETEQTEQQTEQQAGETEQQEKSEEQQRAEEASDDLEQSSPAVQGLIRDVQSERAKRQTLETEVQQLKQTVAAQKPEQGETVVKPTTLAQLAEKYELGAGDSPTMEMLAELEANQQEQRQVNTAASVDGILLQAEKAVSTELGAEAASVGLGYAQVVTEANTLHLTGLDWQNIQAAQPADRPKLIYDKIVARHPELNSKHTAYQSAQKNKTTGGKPPNPKRKSEVNASAGKKGEKPASAGTGFTQQDLLDDKVDLTTSLYGAEEKEES